MNGNFLRILVVRTEDVFVAQCLEHDIVVQAADIDTLQRRFEDALDLEDDLEAVEPAPEHFHLKWDETHKRVGSSDNLEMRLAA